MNPTASLVATALAILGVTARVSHAAAGLPERIKDAVDTTIQPLMSQYRIPGMAVGVIAAGNVYVFNYGVAARATARPVTQNTLFEIGSVSKTLTATLASGAQLSGDLKLSDPTSKYLPSLRDSPFGAVSLLNLGTHTPGGLPLQLPDNIRNEQQLLQYFRQWRPTYPAGTYRTYSNPGIGALGLITARSMGQRFTVLLQRRLLPALGMNSSFIDVPAARMADYAQGYTQEGTPARMAPGVLSAEAYGIKTTVADLLRFIQANLGLIQLDPQLQQAITATHTGYFRASAMTQDLIWEQYAYPVALQTLLQGNSPAVMFNATPVTALTPPQPPRQNVWINKTGSTNGFGAYVAFIPEKRLAIVMLANRNYPIDARVSAAYQILGSLAL
jgi:beta-lactamase class C